jgi:hypothetical protein
MQGVCIDTGATTVLEIGRKYYLFEHGPNYLVSRFDNKNAHCGSYEKKHFELIEERPPLCRHEVSPFKPQRYVAEVARQIIGYRVGDRYIVTDKGPNGYFHVYLMERPNKAPIGSYDADFLKIIGPYDGENKVIPFKRPERPKLEEEPAPALIPSKEAATPKIEPETRSKQGKKKKDDMPAGQMNIFDFLEG